MGRMDSGLEKWLDFAEKGSLWAGIGGFGGLVVCKSFAFGGHGWKKRLSQLFSMKAAEGRISVLELSDAAEFCFLGPCAAALKAT